MIVRELPYKKLPMRYGKLTLDEFPAPCHNRRRPSQARIDG